MNLDVFEWVGMLWVTEWVTDCMYSSIDLYHPVLVMTDLKHYLYSCT